MVNPERFLGTEPTCINLFKRLPKNNARHTVGASPEKGCGGDSWTCPLSLAFMGRLK